MLCAPGASAALISHWLSAGEQVIEPDKPGDAREQERLYQWARPAPSTVPLDLSIIAVYGVSPEVEGGAPAGPVATEFAKTTENKRCAVFVGSSASWKVVPGPSIWSCVKRPCSTMNAAARLPMSAAAELSSSL